MCLPVHRLPAELDRDRGRTTWRRTLPGTSHPDDPARGDLWYPRPIQSGFIRAGGSRETDRVRAELKKGARRAPSSFLRAGELPSRNGGCRRIERAELQCQRPTERLDVLDVAAEVGHRV